MTSLQNGKRARDEGTRFHSMVALSFLLHAVIISILIFSPPTTSSPKWTFGPVHTVDLVSFAGEVMSNMEGQGNEVTVSKEIGGGAHGSRPVVVRKEVDTAIGIPLRGVTKESRGDAPEVARAIESIKKKVGSSQPAGVQAGSTEFGRVSSSGAGGGGGGRLGVTSKVEGTTGTIEMGMRMQVYYAVVWSQIKEKWSLPKGILQNENLVAVIGASVLRNGTVADLKFEQKSGNQYFDESAIKAVKKASPFPDLPEWYKGGSIEIGIRFHSSELQ